jgi:hypothetical protein
MTSNFKNLADSKGFILLTNAEAFEIVGGARRRRRRRPNTSTGTGSLTPPVVIDLPIVGGADEE